MPLEQKDLEAIERIIFKNNDDVAVSIARSFERLEERIDSAESRLYTRMSDVEDRVESSRQDISDSIGEVREGMRDIAHSRLQAEYD
ncbi:MAG: hypothetical protein KGI45_01725 [Patescibacteria group bacterium]|nr:hypothetical protein [Patescibacteria group bacterium]MDE1941283.1 hypothetical protein [Patescibacteria group bacterium]MDE1966776.1 hypothetical protein [Patescibacteria group bacterium]